MKEELIGLLQQFSIKIQNLEMIKGDVPYSVLAFVNSELRSRITGEHNDISFILSYDFVDIKDYIERLQEALPLMKERNLI